MADWIQQIAAKIKAEDHDVAAEARRVERRTKLLQETARQFFHDFQAALIRDTAQLGEDLGDDPTNVPTEVLKNAAPPHQLVVKRRAYPYVEATLTLVVNKDQGSISLTYEKQNPIKGPERGARKNDTFNFEIDDDDSIYLKQVYENPYSFSHPDEFSKHVMKTLFLI